MLRRRATRRIVLIAGVLVPLLVGHVPALAASPTAAQILDQFNLVSSGGDSSQSDIEGNAVIGGTLSGNGTFFNNDVPASPTVSVYGAVSGTGISLDAGGSLYAPSAPAPGRVNFNGGGTYRGAAVQPLSAYTTPLSTLSGSLAGLSRNSTIVDRNGTATFDAVAGRDGLAVRLGERDASGPPDPPPQPASRKQHATPAAVAVQRAAVVRPEMATCPPEMSGPTAARTRLRTASKVAAKEGQRITRRG